MNGLTIILALVTILAIIGTISSLKGKNLMGILFGLATLGVFGWFTIMTIIKDGYPH
ncbi:DUF2759 domain-containing protein [Jeotgalibacillus proteolyticus]|uniref:DUF2759 domain-containing protein n=1 Tax=Jeotgalibacillus proteolyticus TaxID=2082395 RepID=A0A2S5GEI5_9BACL|nr:DUF2759 domain-containing protein [Jeotgalibacillus proteolyticus]PPA71406.1 DUF2759 domain-containing protein [Jeotgalibacillus proteolyticus]